jgi:uncharacterized SAM-binding protein YcdF (DUF218 family)
MPRFPRRCDGRHARASDPEHLVLHRSGDPRRYWSRPGVTALLARAARLAGRFAALSGLLLAATFAALVGFTAGYPPRVEPPEWTPLVVVLGGGIRYDGVLHPRSNHHMRTAIRFFEEGRTRHIHFSGGSLGPIPEAQAMRRLAVEAGIPESATTIEDRSTSTLQNALFTIEAIGPLPPGTVIVTDRSHLPRAWLSFWWAGARDHVLYPAPVWANERRENRLMFIARESLALWYNLARMVEASALLWFGVDPSEVAERLGRSPVAWGPPS